MKLFLAAVILLLLCIVKAQTKEIHPMPYLYISEVISWILNDEFVICDDCPGETFDQDEFDMLDSLLTNNEVIDEGPSFKEKKCFIDEDDIE